VQKTTGNSGFFIAFSSKTCYKILQNPANLGVYFTENTPTKNKIPPKGKFTLPHREVIYATE
jgi:hypothetical protein